MLSSRARSKVLLPLVVVLAVLAVLPLGTSDVRTQSTLTIGVVFAIAAVGLDIFAGYGGQISVGNFGFVAVGAYTSAILATDHGWNPWLTLPMSVLAAGLVGLVLGIPMIRLPELGAAFITFFFSFLVTLLLAYGAIESYTRGQIGLLVPSLEMDGLPVDQTELYYVSFAILVVVSAIAVRYATSRAGKALRVVKRSAVVAAVLGIDVPRARLSAFVFSAMAAGAAGFAFAQVLGYLAPESFPGHSSLLLLIMAVVGGLGSLAGPIVGAVVLSYVDQLARGAGGERDIIFALVLLAVLIVLPEGLYGGLELAGRQLKRVARPGLASGPGTGDESTRAEDVPVAKSTPPAPRIYAADGSPLLDLSGVGVSFGGVRALDGVTMRVRQGEIHALMGPNGAGKTTLLNCIAGIQRHRGDIQFEEHSLSSVKPKQIRRLGVSRTFQNPSLVGDLTVRENVELGTYGNSPSGIVRDILPLPGTFRRDRRARADAEKALVLMGIPEPTWDTYASGLGLAEQKLVDIARAMVSRPRLLLLDEPTAGLHGTEVDHLQQAILRVNKETGVTVLVIAHHVGFLRGIADQATVLNFGSVFAAGSPSEVAARDDVVEIFVGATDVQ